MENLTLPTLRNKISMCVKNLMRYNDLGFILNNIDSAILLPMPIKTTRMTQLEYSSKKDFSTLIYDQCKNTLSLFLEEVELRKNTFENIRKKYPNFCTDIQTTITPEEYENYINLLRKVKQTLSYIHKEVNSDNIDLNELLLFRKDNVSSLIDSDISIRLSNIEDIFVLKELKKIDITLFPPLTQQNIAKIQSDIIIRNEKFTEYSKLQSAKKIEFKLKALEGREIVD